MEKLFFVFCKGDLMLEKLPDGTYTIPYGENAPTETKPWTNMMNVSPLGDTAVCTYSIDHPVTDNPRYEMCGLRQSYYKITKELYLKAAARRAKILMSALQKCRVTTGLYRCGCKQYYYIINL